MESRYQEQQNEVAKTLGNRMVDRRVVFGPESWAFAADNGAEKSR